MFEDQLQVTAAASTLGKNKKKRYFFWGQFRALLLCALNKYVFNLSGQTK